MIFQCCSLRAGLHYGTTAIGWRLVIMNWLQFHSQPHVHCDCSFTHSPMFIVTAVSLSAHVHCIIILQPLAEGWWSRIDCNFTHSYNVHCRWWPSGTDLGHPADAACHWRSDFGLHCRGRNQPDSVVVNAAWLDLHLLQQLHGDLESLTMIGRARSVNSMTECKSVLWSIFMQEPCFCDKHVKGGFCLEAVLEMTTSYQPLHFTNHVRSPWPALQVTWVVWKVNLLVALSK